MARDTMETETLAKLYLEQGHPERAAPIYERLLEEDPARSSVAEGLARCRAAMRARRTEGDMEAERRLSVLKQMLARLTGAEPEPVGEAMPAAPLKADPRERKLQLLRAMLLKLQGTKASHPQGG